MLLSKTKNAPSVHFWFLALLLSLVFLTGGSSRTDVQSLPLFQPISILAFGIAVFTIRRNHIEGRGWLFGFCLAAIAVSAFGLVPLPPGWAAMGGRSMLADIDLLSGMTGLWRPLSLAPQLSWQALSSLFAPMAVLLLGIQLNREDLFRILELMVGLGAVSAGLGLLQILSNPDGPLYFYRITNNGSAVGLFANRNHAAVLLACMFPMLAVLPSIAPDDYQRNVRRLVAAGMAIVLVPLVLVTGSRSGMIMSLIGLLGAAILYRPPSRRMNGRQTKSALAMSTGPVLAGLAVICLALLTVLFSRAQAIDRLFGDATSADRRGFWATSIDVFWRYVPFGSGSGTFAETYQVSQPIASLDPSYLNRAHNDWIETAVTLGVPGLLLLAALIIIYGIRTYRMWEGTEAKRRSVTMGRMASILLAMLAAASFFDYPLRTPSMMCFFAIALLWFEQCNVRKAIPYDASHS